MRMAVIAALVAAVAVGLGLAASAWIGAPPGPAVVLAAAGLFGVSLARR